jgi:hypothetical protein
MALSARGHMSVVGLAVLAALHGLVQGQSSNCYPYGIYTAGTREDRYAVQYYVEISEGTPSPSGGRTTAMTCKDIKGVCPWATANCDETSASWSVTG